MPRQAARMRLINSAESCPRARGESFGIFELYLWALLRFELTQCYLRPGNVSRHCSDFFPPVSKSLADCANCPRIILCAPDVRRRSLLHFQIISSLSERIVPFPCIFVVFINV